uniref:Peptidyl-tRNA hydrolase 2, mitochondrial n=1 Tax=Phallusia mammillata TaxID=59560 RepID=A0A6F9DPE1_9ASCI|nr:peptidyl-tRNA hydrolase 2, mitochondrial-like [Phallusia mammillata]
MQLPEVGGYVLCTITGFGLGCILRRPQNLRYIGQLATKNCKMVMVVRNDLSMGTGKIAAQCAHAAVSAVTQIQKTDNSTLQLWLLAGQPKIVVQCNDKNELMNVVIKASEAGINTVFVRDAGRTQVEAGTETVCAVGPATSSEVNKITGRLKLL